MDKSEPENKPQKRYTGVVAKALREAREEKLREIEDLLPTKITTVFESTSYCPDNFFFGVTGQIANLLKFLTSGTDEDYPTKRDSKKKRYVFIKVVEEEYKDD